jgi:hypothetical protein
VWTFKREDLAGGHMIFESATLESIKAILTGSQLAPERRVIIKE